MPLEFQRAIEEMEIWSANSDGYSFAISFFKTFSGPGFHGRTGYVASWRPLYGGQGAIKVIGSPFRSFDEAEAACGAILKNLMSDWQPVLVPGSPRTHTRHESKQAPEVDQASCWSSTPLPNQ
jgi:hypothetical protein